jgi:hypothetical protein
VLSIPEKELLAAVEGEGGRKLYLRLRLLKRTVLAHVLVAPALTALHRV